MKITLTKNQYSRISEILGNGGLLVIASVVIPFILDQPNPGGVIWGIVIASFLWYSSLVAARKY